MMFRTSTPAVFAQPWRAGVFFLLLMLGLGGCGYHFEAGSRRLPGDAQSLALLPVQNRTDHAGLETHLASELRALLRANEKLTLKPRALADLTLTITLISLQEFTQGAEADAGVGYRLRGQVVLEDRRNHKTLWSDPTLTVETGNAGTYDTTTLSRQGLTPALRDVAQRYAAQVHHRIFLDF